MVARFNPKPLYINRNQFLLSRRQMPGKQSTALLISPGEKQIERFSIDEGRVCLQKSFSATLFLRIEAKLTKSLERIKANFRIHSHKGYGGLLTVRRPCHDDIFFPL